VFRNPAQLCAQPSGFSARAGEPRNCASSAHRQSHARQRFIIKENVKDLPLPKAPVEAPETIGDIVPEDVKLYSLPPLAAKKVAQAKSHLYFVKEGNNAIVLVSPNDRRVADVIH
jgi:hypothetical protein